MATRSQNATAFWASALKWGERLLPGLTRYKRRESLPIALHRKRIYIVPTRFGLVFGITLAAMLLGSLNFNNNSALFFTFLLSGIVFLTVFRTANHMAGLSLRKIEAGPVFSGETAIFDLRFESPKARCNGLRLRQGTQTVPFAIVDHHAAVALPIKTGQRGWNELDPIIVSTEFPLGLFYAWSVMGIAEPYLAYPKPEERLAPLQAQPDDHRYGGRKERREETDWFAFRDYRAGDPIKNIAWKASAKKENWLLNEYRQPTSEETIFDWEALLFLEKEERISRLTRWVVEAGRRGLAWQLRLPAINLGPANTEQHYRQCLKQLALLP